MSMSTHVVGFVPPDESWKKMKEVWDACKAAGIAVPRKVELFFNESIPDEQGVQIELPVTSWSDGERGCEGFELEVAEIPPHVKTIRFYNSW